MERLVVERSAGGDRAHTLSTARDTIESRLSPVEFTALVSMIMAVTALAIDMMLPAFGVMKPDFGLAESSNALAPIVTFFLIGLGAGQLLWGPLSDALGRKRRSNLVVRWEYIPGSEIFLVWSQGITGFDNNGEANFNTIVDNQIFNQQPQNTFLIKATYRFVL